MFLSKNVDPAMDIKVLTLPDTLTKLGFLNSNFPLYQI